jgi:hypothetical protein
MFNVSDCAVTVHVQEELAFELELIERRELVKIESHRRKRRRFTSQGRLTVGPAVDWPSIDIFDG